MSVISLERDGLSKTDVSVLTALSYKLSARGLAGVCVSATMGNGQQMVAILNLENEDILLGFGKDQEGYYVFDWEGRPLAESCSCLDEILVMFA